MSVSNDTSPPQQPVMVPALILPAKAPFMRHDEELFDHFKPFEMETLPPLFIPTPAPGRRRRMPPILRRGYPLTPEAHLRLIREVGYKHDKLPDPLSLRGQQVILAAETVLSRHLQTRVAVQFVHGSDDTNGYIIEVCNNYEMEKALSPEKQEQLRKDLLAEGQPKWYIDVEKQDWEWED